MWSIEQAIENHPVLSFIVGKDFCIEVISGGLCKTLDIDPSKVLHTPIGRINQLPCRKKHIRRALQGSAFNIKFALQEQSFETHLNPIRDENDNIIAVACFSIDVTSSLELEQFLDEERHRIFASQRLNSLASITNGLAHEVNNPLAIISGYAEQMQTMVSSENIPVERVQLAASKIVEASMRCGKIINALKDFARDGSNDPFESVSVRDIVKESINACSQKITSSGIIFQTKNIDLDTTIYCREAQIKQVVFNLLANAIDASLKEENAKLLLEVSEDDEQVKIQVADNGKGIPKSIQHRIFEPFFTTKEVGHGAGIGLSVSRGIMKDHHGDIDYRDDQGLTCFVLCFPKNLPVSHAS